MDEQTLLAQIREALTEFVEDVDLSTVGPSTHLLNDLGIDSMDASDLAYSFSERYDKDIPFERWFMAQREADDYTVGSFIRFLQEHI